MFTLEIETDRYDCEECGHPLKEGDETHYAECSQMVANAN